VAHDRGLSALEEAGMCYFNASTIAFQITLLSAAVLSHWLHIHTHTHTHAHVHTHALSPTSLSHTLCFDTMLPWCVP